MNARPYQSEARAACHDKWKTDRSTLVVMPTGTGKTPLLSFVIQDFQPRRAMVLAHREELIWQARDKVRSVTNLDCGIEMGELYVNNSLFGETPVVISTIQTQTSTFGDRRRMSRFKPEDFGLLIIDEAHRSAARTYLDAIGYYSQNPDLKILGVTATPDRHDKEALGQIFQSVAYDYEILDAIQDGWLVPIAQQMVHINGLDFSNIHTTCGDLNGPELAKLMESERVMQGVTGASLDIIGNKRAIFFTKSVHQAEQGCEIFNRHKPGMAGWVCGETNKDRRRELLARFQGGDIQVMFNCGVLTEGYDNDGVEVIVMAHPTKSRSRYAQMAGRGTRPLNGLVDQFPTAEQRRAAIAASLKPHCLILDFVGNSGKHKLMSAADILGGKVSEQAARKVSLKAATSGEVIIVSDALLEAQRKIQEEAEKRRLAEQAKRDKLITKVKYSVRTVNPFDVFDIQPMRNGNYESGRKLSEKQELFLMRQGINPDKMSFAQGQQLVAELNRRFRANLCTLRQAERLAKFGFNPKHITRTQASALLDQLKARSWRKPSPAFIAKVDARVNELRTKK